VQYPSPHIASDTDIPRFVIVFVVFGMYPVHTEKFTHMLTSFQSFSQPTYGYYLLLVYAISIGIPAIRHMEINELVSGEASSFY